MTIFTAMECACGLQIEPDPELARTPKKATSWTSCIYRCVCGRAYSNAKTASNRRIVWQHPELNVPDQVRAGLTDALAAAMCANHRI